MSLRFHLDLARTLSSVAVLLYTRLIRETLFISGATLGSVGDAVALSPC